MAVEAGLAFCLLVAFFNQPLMMPLKFDRSLACSLYLGRY